MFKPIAIIMCKTCHVKDGDVHFLYVRFRDSESGEEGNMDKPPPEVCKMLIQIRVPVGYTNCNK